MPSCTQPRPGSPYTKHGSRRGGGVATPREVASTRTCRNAANTCAVPKSARGLWHARPASAAIIAGT